MGFYLQHPVGDSEGSSILMPIVLKCHLITIGHRRPPKVYLDEMIQNYFVQRFPLE
jgi:hypothetical protein